ncbi:MAG: hypothetical protein LC745_07295 [Planctomycetia bacterium]|nr:hypothetical protein [Planctomycetia bacterium]
MARRFMLIALGVLLIFPALATAAAITRSATGTSPGSIQAAVDQFRADLGGANNGVGGTFPNGRREINWDGVPDAASAPNALPANFFNSNSPRGVVFSTAGTGFQVSAKAGNPTSTAVRFANLNPTYSNEFQTFSPERLFTAIGSNITDVTFFVPGTTNPAVVSGFGAVFTDLDSTTSTSIQFYDQSGASLGIFAVPAFSIGAQTLSFLGVSFNGGERVSRVRIRSGDVALGANDNPAGGDVVVMDDFIYGEPQAANAVAGGCITDATSLCLNGGRFKVQATFRVPPGQTTTAQSTGIAADSGAFWFFSANNLELLVKVLDGRAFNAKYWVFIASGSGVEYTVTVTDTTNGAVKTYFNPFGTLASTADISAFAP